ncbi:Sulfite oxidase and related enzyme [Thioalkalivibrio nitratireducens DSM 14787]|uniref:Sulfite oxidase and related enzyme n=1 Tax=Thioalkalivibrio nitratireducens (strain DSM 14787 / UNIQEM 213 / ALEN2) TaxID=1255043 RepID=L0DRC7_THIND|nr:Sulfite oxidase and related enzyme [Thioalkalivibrio nitratireducens DSM 14787]
MAMMDRKKHRSLIERTEQKGTVGWDTLDAAGVSRRSFLGRVGKGSAALAVFGLGSEAAIQGLFGRSTLSSAVAAALEEFRVEGKVDGFIYLNDRPINGELPPHLLHDEVTPFPNMFIRNNGVPPAKDSIDPSRWTLTVSGEAADREVTYSIADLKSKFENVTLQIWIECGGNGRAAFEPSPRGNQWDLGAIGCPEWTGVRLRDVLEDAGYDRDKAVYIGYEAGDAHLSGRPDLDAISRGCPMRKALEDETIIAFAMNGEDIPEQHGYPLRLIVPGFPGSASGKWLQGILIRDREHDGEKMTGYSYRVPAYPVEPGADVPEEDMVILEEMPVKSLITFPETGVRTTVGAGLKVEGKAWDGYGDVEELHVSIDHGATWQKAKLNRPRNRFAWQTWEADIEFPTPGYYQVWAKATNRRGESQPMRVPGWNPRGYGNNRAHHIDVYVEA